MKNISPTELFGSHNLTQYLLCLQSADYIEIFESQNNRLATDQEINELCKTAIFKQEIVPTDEIVKILAIATKAFIMGEGYNFLDEFRNRPDKTFTNDDGIKIKRIVETAMKDFENFARK